MTKRLAITLSAVIGGLLVVAIVVGLVIVGQLNGQSEADKLERAKEYCLPLHGDDLEGLAACRDEYMSR